MADPILNIIKSDDYNYLLSDKINYNFNTLADCINRIIPERGDIGIPGAKGADGLKGATGISAPKIYIYDKSYNASNPSSVSMFKSWCSDKGVLDGSVVIFANDGIIASVDGDYSINETYVNIPEDTLDTILSSEYDTKFIFSFGLDNSVYLRKYMCIPDYVKGIILAKSVTEEIWNKHNEVFPGFISLFADNQNNKDKDWYISNTLNGIQLGINNAGRLIENDSAYFKYTTIHGVTPNGETKETSVSDFIVYIDKGNSSVENNKFGARIVNSLKGNNKNVFFSFGSGKEYYKTSSGINGLNDTSFLLSDPGLNYISVSADKISTSSHSFIFQVGGHIYNIKNSTYNGVNIRAGGSYKVNDNFFNLYDIYSGLALTYTTSEPENQDEEYGKEIFNIETKPYSDNFTQMVVSGGSFSTKKDNIFTGSVVISGGDSYFLKYYPKYFPHPGKTVAEVGYSPAATYYSDVAVKLDKKEYGEYENIGGSVFIEGGKLTTLDKENSDGYTPILINSCNNDEKDENIGYDRTRLDINTVSINSSKLIYMYGYNNIFFNKLKETNIQINNDVDTRIEFNVTNNLFFNHNIDDDKPISSPTGSVLFRAKNIYFSYYSDFSGNNIYLENKKDAVDNVNIKIKNLSISSYLHFGERFSAVQPSHYYYWFDSDSKKNFLSIHREYVKDKLERFIIKYIEDNEVPGRYTKNLEFNKSYLANYNNNYTALSFVERKERKERIGYHNIEVKQVKLCAHTHDGARSSNVKFYNNSYTKNNGNALSDSFFIIRIKGEDYVVKPWPSQNDEWKNTLILKKVRTPSTRISNN